MLRPISNQGKRLLSVESQLSKLLHVPKLCLRKERQALIPAEHVMKVVVFGLHVADGVGTHCRGIEHVRRPAFGLPATASLTPPKDWQLDLGQPLAHRDERVGRCSILHQARERSNSIVSPSAIQE